jgi:hypothetical protein
VRRDGPQEDAVTTRFGSLALAIWLSAARAGAQDAAPTAVPDTAATETAAAETAAPPTTAPPTTAPPTTVLAEAPSDAPEPESVAAAPAREPDVGLRAHAEIGFLAVLAHEITLGLDGTRIDYPRDVNQSNLSLFLRVSADLDIWRQHIITFVYQPIDLVSEASLPRDLRIDGLDYARGTPTRARYSFPFYRLGWAFDVLEGRDEELAFGIGFQIRNANIQFESLDGSLFRERNDVGFVPLLRARGRFPIANGWFFGFDVVLPGLNGRDNNVEGAILDLSVRLGWRFLPHVDAFLSARYLGGGASGQGSRGPFDDGYQRNWLHFLTIALGVTFDTRP